MLLTFVSREVSDILKPAYAFGGLSLSQMIKADVDNFRRTRQSVSDLIHSFSQFILLTNMGASQTAEGRKLFDRVDFMIALRDNRNMAIADKETEDIKNVSAPLGTLDALQAQSQEHICASSGLPLIKFTGLTPTGLNASSEGEIRSFYDWIHATQEFYFASPFNALLTSSSSASSARLTKISCSTSSRCGSSTWRVRWQCSKSRRRSTRSTASCLWSAQQRSAAR
jgi:hypothetical protein